MIKLTTILKTFFRCVSLILRMVNFFIAPSVHMEEAEVAVSPRVGFGEEGKGWLRIALVENEKRIRQAIRQIKRMSWNGREN